MSTKEDEVEILIYGSGVKILYGCMDLESYKALEDHSDGYLENILWDSDKLYELTKEKYLSMYELDNSQSWQGADLDAHIKITVNNEVIVNDRFDEVFDVKKVLDYSKRANSDFGTENYIRFTKKPAAQATIIGNSNIKGEIIKCNFKTVEAFDIENFKFLILDAEYEGYSKFVESIYYKSKFIDHWGNSSYDEQGWTFDVSKPKIQDKNDKSSRTILSFTLSFWHISEKANNITEFINDFESRCDTLILAINMLEKDYGLSQKNKQIDNVSKFRKSIRTFLDTFKPNDNIDLYDFTVYERDTITGIDDFEDDGEQLTFSNIEVNSSLISLDEELLSISEDFSIEARDAEKQWELYSSYNLGEHVSGYFM